MIKAWDYLPEYERDRDAILAAVDGVFRSGQLILGEHVRRFEEEFAAFCASDGAFDRAGGHREPRSKRRELHGIGVDNGTNAIALALKALGIGAGDEVVTTPLTAVPTVSAIVATGATPVFVDVDPQTLLLDVPRVEAALTARTRAVVPVHLYGQCVPMAPLLAVAERRGIAVVEDCAQAAGAMQHGRRAGSFGTAAAFSFYPTKPLGAFGDGGMVVTADAALVAKLKRLRFYGMERSYYAEESGGNARLDEVQAAILRVRLGRLDADNARRRHLAARYRQRLAGTALRLIPPGDGDDPVYHQFVVRHPDRDRLVAALTERGIGSGVHYPWPIHSMRGFRQLGYRDGDMPQAEAAARQLLSLPLYPSLSDDAVEQVCDVLASVL